MAAAATWPYKGMSVTTLMFFFILFCFYDLNLFFILCSTILYSVLILTLCYILTS